MNGTAIEHPRLHDGLRYTIMALCCLVFILGVTGNALVLIVFGRKWGKLKSCEIFMVNLALADFLSSLITPAKTLAELLQADFAPVGNSGCRFISFMAFMPMTVSALTLLAVSIDRFIIVKWPLHERPYHSTIVIVIALIWTIAGGMGSMYLINGHIGLNDFNKCANYMSDRTYIIFSIIVIVVQSFLPITVMTVLYTLIVYELRRSAANGFFDCNSRAMKVQMTRIKRSTHMVVTIVIVFYVCILPTHIFQLTYMHKDVNLIDFQQMLTVLNIVTIPQICNSIANPLVYSKLHESFRKDTAKLLCPCFYKQNVWNRVQMTMRTIFHSTKTISSPLNNSTHFNSEHANPMCILEVNSEFKSFNCEKLAKIEIDS